ncbi:LysE family transporter [Sphingobium cupriresistens]|uniref:LysE family transporter n=1 Tax=Sphingobium TaxID=165695 RepID=UPI0024142A08|nr:LysE family transporter [Sphingobium cupriresistens]
MQAVVRSTWRQGLLNGFAVTIGNPKMAAFFFGLFAPIAGQAAPINAHLAALIGIVLVDFIYHQTLVQLAAIAAQSGPAESLTG